MDRKMDQEETLQNIYACMEQMRDNIAANKEKLAQLERDLYIMNLALRPTSAVATIAEDEKMWMQSQINYLTSELNTLKNKVDCIA